MLRLMIADDEQIIRETLAEIIDYEALGYTLIAAARNGMEAYEIICDEYPDVVITDIRMPILGGLELIERAMKSDSNITFILLSGYSEFEYAKQAMRYGVRHYLLKPTDKDELIDALNAVRQERLLESRHKEESRREILAKLEAPLEQCFLMEALESLDNFPPVYRKYQSLLSIPYAHLTACVCSYVEEVCLKRFASDVYQYFAARHIPLCFPVLYVRNNAILIFQAAALKDLENLKEYLSQLTCPGQTVTFEPNILHPDTSLNLFHTVFGKLSRFEQILMLDPGGKVNEIHNNIASPSQINRITEAILLADNSSSIGTVLDTVFDDQLSLDTARHLALGLFLKLNPIREEQPLDAACDFFHKLYSCTDISAVKDFMQVATQQKKACPSSERQSPNITLLKAYVKKHYANENLSLKWLAENYLFVSVGYLSKQFVKEEGIRFSDYLNRVRMEEATRLMRYYHSDNINNIARQVGFGNNPQYFRQVFKRYHSCTPSEYLKNLQPA